MNGFLPSFENLRIHYGTGRGYTISGTGRDRVLGCRIGVTCNLGDIERSRWSEMMRELIQCSDEQQIYNHLVHYLKEHNYAERSKAQLEMDALEQHSMRVFDDPLWIGYVEFNRTYRPNVLRTVGLRWIQTDCCSTPGQITQALLEKNKEIAPCPHCGRWASYTILKKDDDFYKEGDCALLARKNALRLPEGFCFLLRLENRH